MERVEVRVPDRPRQLRGTQDEVLRSTAMPPTVGDGEQRSTKVGPWTRPTQWSPSDTWPSGAASPEWQGLSSAAGSYCPAAVTM